MSNMAHHGEEVMEHHALFQQFHRVSSITMEPGAFLEELPKIPFQVHTHPFQCHITANDTACHQISTLVQKYMLFHCREATFINSSKL